MITFVFSMRGPTLTDQQASAFRAYAQWRVVNERSGRLLVDGIGEADNLLAALGALTAMGRDPVAIGAWQAQAAAHWQQAALHPLAELLALRSTPRRMQARTGEAMAALEQPGRAQASHLAQAALAYSSSAIGRQQHENE